MRSIFLLPVVLLSMPSGAIGQSNAPNASERMNAAGSEVEALAKRAGLWDVVRTVWPSPGAAPIVARMRAERRMVGNFLQEDLFLVSDPNASAVARIDYLHFNRIERRWQYVSMDTRFPGGIMPAWSFDRGTADTIALRFEPIAMVGFGSEPDTIGRMERAEMTITRRDANHETKLMRVLMTDGEGEPWKAVQFEYTRRNTGQ